MKMLSTIIFGFMFLHTATSDNEMDHGINTIDYALFVPDKSQLSTFECSSWTISNLDKHLPHTDIHFLSTVTENDDLGWMKTLKDVQFFNTIESKETEEFERIYHHHSINDETEILFTFKRWFYIANHIKQYSLEGNILVMDTNVS